MRLRELELKNFGKFHDKRLEFTDGIHVIYGPNESGKTTIHTFIRAMLFGMERGRGRASLKDTFSRYEPWEYSNYYAGSLRFESSGKDFVLRRNFDKYSKKTELYCETDGEELSVADGDLEMLLDGLGRASYEDTLYVGQLRATTEQSLAAELRNYAAGYYVTGDSDIDVSAAREVLFARKKEADRAARALTQEKQRKREQLELSAGHIWRDMHHMDEERKELEEELRCRGAEEEQRKEPEAPASRWRVHPLEVAVILLAGVLLFCGLPAPWNAFVTVIVLLLGALYIWNRMKVDRREQPEFAAGQPEEGLISTEKLRWKQEQLTEMRREKQVEYENLQESLRELDELSPDHRETDQQRAVLTLAIEQMDRLVADMQRQVGKRLDQRVSEIVAQLTDGKYTRLTVDEALQINVWQQERQIPVERLSQGTVEQLYFALRMAAAELLYAEEFPIILDDTFAFYDDARLRRALQWLADSGKQVLLFTCHHREEEFLAEVGLPYTRIQLP